MPPSLPPQKLDKMPQSADKHVAEVQTSSPVDNKVADLRVYRKGWGLYQFCAEKYFLHHKCAPTVQLHVVQELWEMLLIDSDPSTEEVQSNTEAAALHMLLSKEAQGASNSSRMLKFLGEIQGNSIVLLIDYGSSHSFINERLASSLAAVTSVAQFMAVQVANGQMLHSNFVIDHAEWQIQGYTFSSSLKVIPLPYYDMIICINWCDTSSVSVTTTVPLQCSYSVSWF
jgi:hypothetical protein